MSFRNLRKIYGNNDLPPPEDSSDEDFQPLYAKGSSSKSRYQGLELITTLESENESADTVATENIQPEELNKKKMKKKRIQQKHKSKVKTTTKDSLDMNDLDQWVKEIDAALGIPARTADLSEKPNSDPTQDLMSVQQKHLSVSNELKRLFGPEVIEENRRRGGQQNTHRYLKKLIVPSADHTTNFQKAGLSMSVQRREDGYTYFTFDHNPEYQRVHRSFLNVLARSRNLPLSVEIAQKGFHVEGLLEVSDSMFRLEEYTTANNLIEQTIAYMQYVAHPSFILTDNKVRLEYKYIENRPFHVALLKYLHLLTNRACHRTALEVAKVLLNLDPSDPLAVLLIIDTLALRAREHQWLIDVTDNFFKKREAALLFNIQYSYALAHFHVAFKKKADTTTANKLLQEAIMRFPKVAMNILNCANVKPNEKVQNHPLFTSQNTTTRILDSLIVLYAKLSWPKWREPDVFDWFNKNILNLIEEYDNNTNMQARAKDLANENLNLFQICPREVTRYFCVIKPMAELLVDGAVPPVNRTHSADPLPPQDGINRYGYSLNYPVVINTNNRNSTFYEMFASFLPGYDNEATDLERNVFQHYFNSMDLQEVNEIVNNVGNESILVTVRDNPPLDGNEARGGAVNGVVHENTYVVSFGMEHIMEEDNPSPSDQSPNVNNHNNQSESKN